MITYQIHSVKTNLNLQFEYCDNGRLVGFRMLTEALNIDESVRASIFNSLPGTVEQLKVYCVKNKIELVAVVQDISFTAFWNRYAYKEGGSKKKAEQKWNKLDDAEKTKALNYIQRYRQHCESRNIAQAYALTYLNGEYWNNK